MRTQAVLLISFLLVSCTSAPIPRYLKEENPYVKRYYASFEETQSAVRSALDELGWKIKGKADPAVYEQVRAYDEASQQILLFTEIRQTPMFFGTRYAKMDIYLKSKDNMTDVEIRYLTITSVLFRNIYNYRNDSAVERIFTRISDLLSSHSVDTP